MSELRQGEVAFLRGVLFALSQIDPHSTEYREIVLQAGGFDLLHSVAEEHDSEHLTRAIQDEPK